MTDFYSREQRLELKLQWNKYRMEILQRQISGTVIYLMSIKYHLEKIEYHAAQVQELKEYVGFDLGEIYQELEALKSL